MGWECYYSGSLQDLTLQEKVIRFVQTFWEHPPDLIVKPYPDIKYDVRVSYRKNVDESGQVHNCCNDFCHEKIWWKWKRYASVEQIIHDYPCNYYGMIQSCDLKDGTIYGGDFIFDRTAGGRLIEIDKLFPIYLKTQTENGNNEIPESESMVEIKLRGNVRKIYGFPLLLNVIKLRWWPDLDCSDDEDLCVEIAENIWKYGLTKKLMDENLNYDECEKLYYTEHEKYFPPPPPEKPAPEEKKTLKPIVVPDGIMEWPITELNLCVRASRCMERMNIKTIGDLMQKSEDEILKQKNTGRKCVAQIN